MVKNVLMISNARNPTLACVRERIRMSDSSEKMGRLKSNIFKHMKYSIGAALRCKRLNSMHHGAMARAS